jgi:hypothetical protein
MASATVPGFLPSTTGFHFANAFPRQPAIRLGLPGVIEVGIGNASAGLCGGMCHTIRDLFEAQLPPPADTSPPTNGDRFDYIVRRQVDSLDWLRVPIRFYDLQALRPDPLAWWNRALRRWSRAAVMIRAEWPRVRAEIDAGDLSMVGLIKLTSLDPRLLGRNHQVVAYGYEVNASRLALRIYDPNFPNRDDLELRVALADGATTVSVEYTTGEQVVCFFRTPYRRRDPAPWR